MQARDIMTPDVVTAAPGTPVQRVAGLMVEHRISGMPVVGDGGQVVGIVTEGDLCRRMEIGTERRRGRWLELLTDNAELARDYVRAHGRTAADVMTRQVLHVAPGAAVSEIADLFESRRIKRVPVLDHGRLVGIVSRGNLVQAIAAYRPPPPAAEEADRRIRADVLKAYAHQPWGLRSESNVVVHEGVVHLWGVVHSGDERAALRVAAEAVPGVKAVEDHMILIDGTAPPVFGAAVFGATVFGAAGRDEAAVAPGRPLPVV